MTRPQNKSKKRQRRRLRPWTASTLFLWSSRAFISAEMNDAFIGVEAFATRLLPARIPEALHIDPLTTTRFLQHNGQRIQNTHSTSRLFTLNLYLDDNQVTLLTNQTESASSGANATTITAEQMATKDRYAASTTSTLPPQQQQVQQSMSRNNFGDIMSPVVDDAGVLFQDGLVTSESYSLAKVYGIHHPLDRMAITANGNLQRLFSSYYDAPVQVVVEYCHAVAPGRWNRRVQLQLLCANQADNGASLPEYKTFCVADSTVQVHTPECQALVESGQVGLGQLFRHLNLLPEFALQAAGPSSPESSATMTNSDSAKSSDQDTGFWRKYTLDCPGVVTCEIHERFIPGVWNLPVKTEDHL